MNTKYKELEAVVNATIQRNRQIRLRRQEKDWAIEFNDLMFSCGIRVVR